MDNIKGCIGFLKGKNNNQENTYLLNITDIKKYNNSINIEFEVEKELPITSGTIDISLYRTAHNNNWFTEGSKYYPLWCIVDKKDFDSIRKGITNTRKISNTNAKIDELKKKNDWEGIVKNYEPLETIETNADIWNNAYELGELAYACSKLGEPKNGKEKDKSHLAFVKKYRELSIKYYLRCVELEPNNVKYISSIAYRYYLNVMELTKAKGRRDGNTKEEINNARIWFDKALEIRPNSIANNYRKGKMIASKQIENYQHTCQDWTSETHKEIDKMTTEAIKCFEKVIIEYEKITDVNVKKRNSKEYIKTLYNLAKVYLGIVNIKYSNIGCYIIANKDMNNYFEETNNRKKNICLVKAKELLEKCFYMQTEINLDNEAEIIYSQVIGLNKNWDIEPMDNLYQLGVTYLNMYMIKKAKTNDYENIELYKKYAIKYLKLAKQIGIQMKKNGKMNRNVNFINDKIAWYYISTNEYYEAAKILQNSRDSYMKITYCIAQIMIAEEKNLNEAEEKLKELVIDKYNKSENVSIALLGYILNKKGKLDELEKIVMNKEVLQEKNCIKLLNIITSPSITKE